VGVSRRVLRPRLSAYNGPHHEPMADVKSQIVNHLGQVLIFWRGINFERRFSVIDKIPPKNPPPEGYFHTGGV
jgi:hypothetical protein